jgi:hypothetical protein
MRNRVRSAALFASVALTVSLDAYAQIRVGAELQVNTFTDHRQGAAAVSADAGGAFVVVWDSQFEDGAYTGIFARRSTPPSIWPMTSGRDRPLRCWATSSLDSFRARAPRRALCFESTSIPATTSSILPWRPRAGATSSSSGRADGDGVVLPLTDGLLALRYMFNFSGASLTTGAVGGACTRCSAATIVVYLDDLALALDLDDNGVKDPLTDGLLVLRYLFANFAFLGRNHRSTCTQSVPPQDSGVVALFASNRVLARSS